MSKLCLGMNTASHSFCLLRHRYCHQRTSPTCRLTGISGREGCMTAETKICVLTKPGRLGRLLHASGYSLGMLRSKESLVLEGGLMVARLMVPLLRRETECGSKGSQNKAVAKCCFLNCHVRCAVRLGAEDLCCVVRNMLQLQCKTGCVLWHLGLL